MRQNWSHPCLPERQLVEVVHKHANELARMSALLDANSEVSRLATTDLTAGVARDRGAPGMTGDQVVRCTIAKQMNGWSYEELAFHVVDSQSYRVFCRFDAKGPAASTLNDNIRRLKPQTWEAINQVIVTDAVRTGVETGQRSRIDCTVVESNIHGPTDSLLLWDTVRTLTRLMTTVRKDGVHFPFANHSKRAKKRAFEIEYARKKTDRVKPYRDLVHITERCLRHATEAVGALRSVGHVLADVIEHFVELGRRVVNQTRRRVFRGESVPAAEKVVSIFEEHTDVIVKKFRETDYGHKVCMNMGVTGLVLDAVIERGNPADATLTTKMLRRHADIIGQAPLQVALDGSFASRDNLTAAKALGVTDVCFSKRRGMEVAEMASSESVYRELWRFRCGVESYISWLKRKFGLRRCTWRGWEGFQSYIWASIVACNLLILARQGPDP